MTLEQPKIASRRKPVIEVDGLNFRDLDGDGRLAPFEDWRLRPRARAEDLRERLSLSQKAGLFVIGSHYVAGSTWVATDGELRDMDQIMADGARVLEVDPDASMLREADTYMSVHAITGAELTEPHLFATGARSAINQRHQRRFIVRDNLAARDLARWSNELQELAEESEFGIPVVLTSNPRNHVAVGATLGIGEGSGVYSEWPSGLGIAALMDEALAFRFAQIARREWRTSGLRKMYGYTADIPSEPRWARFGETLGEDPDLVARLIAAFVRGFQGDELGADSVALTVKHFPGGGVRMNGHDPHFVWGQENDYPTEGSLERYQLPPFRAAVEAGVSSVMPYYSKPMNTSVPQLPADLWQSEDQQFEEVAFAYNKAFLTSLLRERLGFAGYVNTDSGVLDGMAYGVEHLTLAERWAKLVGAGSDVVSDESDPKDLITAVEHGLLDESDLDRSVTLLLEEMFALGLFENPYVDPDEAEAVANDPESRAIADDTQRRSVTLLRNSDGLLPLTERSAQIYLEVFAPLEADRLTAELRDALAQEIGWDRIATDPAEAATAVLWVQPVLSLFSGDDHAGADISVDPRDRGVDVDAVLAVQQQVPSALVVNLSNPWLMHELEPRAAAVAATYEISPVNLVHVLLGKTAPAGRLPMTLPRSMQAVKDSPRDVPGMFCDDDYAYVDVSGSVYRTGFGIL